MAEPHVITALVRLRRELTCYLAKLQADVAAIDRVLCLIDPALDPTAIRALAFRKREGWADRGQVSRVVSEALRVFPYLNESLGIPNRGDL